MTRQLSRHCPICEHVSGTLRHEQRLAISDELSITGSITVVTCDRCGFAFEDLLTTQAQIDRTYEEHSKYADAAVLADDGRTDPPWDADRMTSVAAWLAQTLPDRGKRVLDAGCAGGSFLAAMKSHGFTNLLGIDPSHRVTSVVHHRYGIDAIAGSFLQLPPYIGTFGLITLQHTLEHLADVRGAIAALRDALDDEGLAYIEVPDARRYADFLAAPFQDFNTEHINHFSLASLDALLQSGGFVPELIAEKQIFTSARHRYPAAYGLWRKSRAVPTRANFDYDAGLVTGINRYVADSHALMRRIDIALREQLAYDRDIILWGTGQLAFKLMCDTVLREKRIVFVDTSPEKHGLHINGAPIVAPGDLPADERPIVMGSIYAADAIAAAIAARFGTQHRTIRLPEGRASATRT